MRIAAIALGLALLAACGGSADPYPGYKHDVEEDVPISIPEKAERSAYCEKCNSKVYENHVCGLTRPCDICGREAGQRHVHELQFYCENCGYVTRQTHLCHDSKGCPLCGLDCRRVSPQRGCARCGRLCKVRAVVGITFFCYGCNREVGPGHICGKTKLCPTCNRDCGPGHVCREDVVEPDEVDADDFPGEFKAPREK